MPNGSVLAVPNCINLLLATPIANGGDTVRINSVDDTLFTFVTLYVVASASVT